VLRMLRRDVESRRAENEPRLPDENAAHRASDGTATFPRLVQRTTGR